MTTLCRMSSSELPNLPELINQLRKLWVLDLVVSSGSFQEAATHAKITRSAVSQTISQLEKYFARNLLVRGHGSVTPTSHCEELLKKARPLLSSLESLA